MRSAIRATFLHFIDQPDFAANTGYEYYGDGVMVINNGLIEAIGNASEILAHLDSSVTVDSSNVGKLIIPGLIDCHTHFPQIDIVAAYGEQLLDWLNNYTYPAEQRFGESGYGDAVAEKFLREGFRNGTTTAMVYCTVHPESVDAFFSASEKYNCRMIAGKVMMDRNAPEELCDTPEQGYEQSRSLIARWHGKGRLAYAVTPRFAPTSSSEQLTLAGRLLREFPDLYLQTHVSENLAEVAWVKELFPECDSYLQVYERHGLLGERTVLGHGIHLNDKELGLMAACGVSIAFCPTSNLFLGSGLLDVERCESAGVNVCLATDIGAGTSFSMLKTMRAAYEVSQLRGHSIPPLRAFYNATLGNARALKIDHYVGNFDAGKEADFIVLDTEATPLLRYRMGLCNNLQEKLFVMMYLGDDRMVASTHIMGKMVHSSTDNIERRN